MSAEQTEKATPQRKKKAREAGDWVRSRELLSGFGMLAGLMAMGASGGSFVNLWRQSYARCVQMAVENARGEWGTKELFTAIRVGLLPAVGPTAMVMAAAFCAVLLVGVGQSGGLHVSMKPMQPKLNRLSVLSHAKQVFSVRTIARVVKSVLPATVVVALGWWGLKSEIGPMPVLSLNRLPATFSVAYGLAVKAAVVMVVWAGVDYAVEYASWAKRLKMSKQEMKEEMKEAMGNPQTKMRVRSAQRAMRKRRVKADMRRASVVITNPTHYAVALEFSFETMSAPTVLAKGRDLHALEMKEEARVAGVPILENKPLARSLYAAVEPGQPIPFELYAAVAGILAFLFREKQEETARESRRAAEQQKEARASAMRAGSVGSAAVQMAGFEGGM
jgi:flagellar biosynthetic protein FlhB